MKLLGLFLIRCVFTKKILGGQKFVKTGTGKNRGFPEHCALPDQRDNILTFCSLTFDAIRIQLCTAFQDYEASIVLEIRNLWYVSVETATRLSMDQFFSNACSLHCTTA